MTHECPLCLEEKHERLLNFHVSLHGEQDDASKAEHVCCVACWNAYMTSVRSKSFSSSQHHHLVTCPFCRQIVFVLYVEKQDNDDENVAAEATPSCHWQDAIVFFLSGFAMLLCTAGCV